MMKKIFYLFTFLLLFIGCEPDSVNEESKEVYPEMQEDLTSAELNEVDGEVEYINFRGKEIPVKDIGEAYLFEGDIMIPKDLDKNYNKSTSIDSAYWWENNTIPYVINEGVNTLRVNNALDHWRQNTNVEFIERTTETDYIYFTTGSGCSSYVGKISGAQPITVSASCSTGNIIHEIGHAAGLWHEHSRADRDEYVDILWENIQSGREHNFQRYTDMLWSSGYDLTPDLDFNSIMMYGSYSFSSNGKPTIIKENGTTYTIQRTALSQGDLYGINIMYPPLNVDSDGDGIIDSEDNCPNEAVQPVGEYNNDGCPWENGQYYDFDDITVYRSGGKWYYFTWNYGWKQVKYSSYGYWYYV